jgi:hypothetical protein
LELIDVNVNVKTLPDGAGTAPIGREAVSNAGHRG